MKLLSKFLILMLGFAATSYTAEKRVKNPDKYVPTIPLGGYTFKYNEQVREFVETFEQEPGCSICGNDGANKFWFGPFEYAADFSFAHADCKKLMKPFDKEFKAEARAKNLKEGMVLYALAHAKMASAVFNSQKKYSLRTFAEQDPRTVQHLFAAFGRMKIVETLQSREIPKNTIFEHMIVSPEESALFFSPDVTFGDSFVAMPSLHHQPTPSPTPTNYNPFIPELPELLTQDEQPAQEQEGEQEDRYHEESAAEADGVSLLLAELFDKKAAIQPPLAPAKTIVRELTEDEKIQLAKLKTQQLMPELQSKLRERGKSKPTRKPNSSPELTPLFAEVLPNGDL